MTYPALQPWTGYPTFGGNLDALVAFQRQGLEAMSRASALMMGWAGEALRIQMEMASRAAEQAMAFGKLGTASEGRGARFGAAFEAPQAFGLLAMRLMAGSAAPAEPAPAPEPVAPAAVVTPLRRPEPAAAPEQGEPATPALAAAPEPSAAAEPPAAAVEPAPLAAPEPPESASPPPAPAAEAPAPIAAAPGKPRPAAKPRQAVKPRKPQDPV